MKSPADDTWVVSSVEDHRWCWAVHWVNGRALAGSNESRDAYAGGGPLLIEKETGRIAWTGSAHSAAEWVSRWLNGEQLRGDPAPAD